MALRDAGLEGQRKLAGAAAAAPGAQYGAEGVGPGVEGGGVEGGGGLFNHAGRLASSRRPSDYLLDNCPTLAHREIKQAFNQRRQT